MIIFAGTEAERGLLKFHNKNPSDDHEHFTDKQYRVYDLPCVRLHEMTENTTCCQYLPICSNFKQDMFHIKCTCTKDCSHDKPISQSVSSNGFKYQNGDVMTLSTTENKLSTDNRLSTDDPQTADLSGSTFTHL